MADTRKAAFVRQFADLLRNARRAEVEGLELSEDGNTVTIQFAGGGRRPVCVEMDSDAALILDVIRKVLLSLKKGARCWVKSWLRRRRWLSATR